MVYEQGQKVILGKLYGWLSGEDASAKAWFASEVGQGECAVHVAHEDRVDLGHVDLRKLRGTSILFIDEVVQYSSVEHELHLIVW